MDEKDAKIFYEYFIYFRFEKFLEKYDLEILDVFNENQDCKSETNYLLFIKKSATILNSYNVRVVYDSEIVEFKYLDKTKQINTTLLKQGHKEFNQIEIVQFINYLFNIFNCELRLYCFYENTSFFHGGFRYFFFCDYEKGTKIFDELNTVQIPKINAKTSGLAVFDYHRVDFFLFEIEKPQTATLFNLNNQKTNWIAKIPHDLDWINLLNHFLDINSYNHPNNQWYTELSLLIDKVGKQIYVETIKKFVKEVIEVGFKKINDGYKKGAKREIRFRGFSIIANEIELNLRSYFDAFWLFKTYQRNYELEILSVKEYDESESFSDNEEFTNHRDEFYITFGGRIIRGILYSSLIFDDNEFNEIRNQFNQSHPGDKIQR